MSDPYAVLGLDPQADVAGIRKRYLELVRQFTPEREPARFTEIHAAYEALKNPVERMKNLLLRHPQTKGNVGEVLVEFRQRHVLNSPLPVSALLSIAEQMKS